MSADTPYVTIARGVSVGVVAKIYCLRGRARTRANPSKPTAMRATEAGSGTVPVLPPLLELFDVSITTVLVNTL